MAATTRPRNKGKLRNTEHCRDWQGRWRYFDKAISLERPRPASHQLRTFWQDEKVEEMKKQVIAQGGLYAGNIR